MTQLYAYGFLFLLEAHVLPRWASVYWLILFCLRWDSLYLIFLLTKWGLHNLKCRLHCYRVFWEAFVMKEKWRANDCSWAITSDSHHDLNCCLWWSSAQRTEINQLWEDTHHLFYDKTLFPHCVTTLIQNVIMKDVSSPILAPGRCNHGCETLLINVEKNKLVAWIGGKMIMGK